MIRLENIYIKSDENTVLIGNINIFIPSGSLVSITGSLGSGKSKLFNILGLQEKASSGNLFILGKNIAKLNRNELSSVHSEISLVCEDLDLVKNLGIEENIILPLIVTNKGKDEISAAVNELVPWLNLNKLLKKRVVNLSRYEKKMVLFARSIIVRPRILLLDNIFEGLDSEYKKKISYLLLALKKIGTTIISFRNENYDDVLDYNKNYKIENSMLVKYEI